jgi:hypothetical protein
MTALRPYRSIEHPQAFATVASMSSFTGDPWALYNGTGIAIGYQSGDDAGQAITTDGTTITISEPGLYVLRVSASYTSTLENAVVTHGQVTLDDAGLTQPSEQAALEGAGFSEHASSQPLAFERTIHVDSTKDIGLWVLHLTGAETTGTITLTDVAVEIERVGPPGYPLPGFWDVNWTDMAVGANARDSGGDPAADGEGVTTWLRREGSADWVVRGTQATMEVDGFGGTKPGLAFPSSHAGYEIDSEAGSFDGDPDFTFAAIFDIGTASLLNNLLSIVDSANDFYTLIGENSSAYRIQRTDGSPSTRTGGTVTTGTHWIVVRRDATAGTVSVWVDDPDTPIIDTTLDGGTFTPDSITFGSYHGSVDSVPTQGIFHGAGLSTGLISQAGVRRFAEHVERWGYG